MNCIALVDMIAVISVVTATILIAPVKAAQPLDITGNITPQILDVNNITTSWNLSFLYQDKDMSTFYFVFWSNGYWASFWTCLPVASFIWPNIHDPGGHCNHSDRQPLCPEDGSQVFS